MTTSQRKRALRVVVCGTSFGRFYLRALRRLPNDFQLVGILAKGSAYSATCAEEHGVPLFTAVSQVPKDVDAACVVVRSAVGGGAGAEIALSLMKRGIHVLQEHPLHHDELAACLRTARAAGVQYQVNAFYEHLDSVRVFLDAARVMRSRQPLLFVDAACASQVLYPLIDILGQAVGSWRPWMLSDLASVPPVVRDLANSSFPYRTLYGVLGGVPLTLRVQNQIDPANPDNHTHLLHRVMLGTEGGVLTLTDPHGPVLWNPRLHANRDKDGRLDIESSATGRFDAPCASVLFGERAPTFRSVFDDLWPNAIARALSRLGAAIDRGEDPVDSGQTALTTCRIWQDLLGKLGEPELVSRQEPQVLPLPELMAVAT
jgi:thiazolinyl imide reductase